MSTFLLLAFAFGLANTALAIGRSLWSYPFGLALAALYGFGFARVGMLREAAMHALFLAAQVWGVIEWRASLRRFGEVRVERLHAREALGWAAGGTALFAAWGLALTRLTPTTIPWLEAGVAAPSLVALLLMARRRVEAWPVWIVADVVALRRTLDVAAWSDLRNFAFPALAALGWVIWARAARAARGDQRPAGLFQART